MKHANAEETQTRSRQREEYRVKRCHSIITGCLEGDLVVLEGGTVAIPVALVVEEGNLDLPLLVVRAEVLNVQHKTDRASCILGNVHMIVNQHARSLTSENYGYRV